MIGKSQFHLIKKSREVENENLAGYLFGWSAALGTCWSLSLMLIQSSKESDISLAFIDLKYLKTGKFLTQDNILNLPQFK